jgi:hypothetical protein
MTSLVRVLLSSAQSYLKPAPGRASYVQATVGIYASCPDDVALTQSYTAS